MDIKFYDYYGNTEYKSLPQPQLLPNPQPQLQPKLQSKPRPSLQPKSLSRLLRMVRDKAGLSLIVCSDVEDEEKVPSADVTDMASPSLRAEVKPQVAMTISKPTLMLTSLTKKEPTTVTVSTVESTTAVKTITTVAEPTKESVTRKTLATVIGPSSGAICISEDRNGD